MFLTVCVWLLCDRLFLAPFYSLSLLTQCMKNHLCCGCIKNKLELELELEVCGRILRRAQACIEAGGGDFKCQLKKTSGHRGVLVKALE